MKSSMTRYPRIGVLAIYLSTEAANYWPTLRKAMPRKNKNTVSTPNLSEHWIRSPSYMANGRHIDQTTELSIQGERGRFRFVQHVHNPTSNTEWIDVVGAKKGVTGIRSFRPDKIKRVHYKKKLRPKT